jgi:penicillin amidase
MGAIKSTLDAMARSLARPLGAVGLRRWLLRRSLPPRREILGVAGCRAPVDIRIDSSGVPHISAENATDLFLAQGYCHARDRLWQMELNRRIARGELAALFGPRAIATDRLLRRLGFRRAAENEAASLDGELRACLDAYAVGVNAYVAAHRLPVEFILLRTRPRPWTSIDSLAFARYMGWSMTVNGESELIRYNLCGVLGKEVADSLEPQTGHWRTDLKGNAALFGDRAGGSLTPVEFEKGRAPFSSDGAASNAWAVSPARSTTGRSLLANDPHLRPRIPAAWYVAHLQGGGFDVAGVTLPGTVGVLAGHNAHVAWGITAGLVDCQDIYEERSDPAQPHRFAFGDGWDDAEVIWEEIAVRGRRLPVVEEVVRTRHGPLLNGCVELPPGSPPLALQCATDRQLTPLAAILQMNRASNVSSFHEALAGWTFPVLNFVIADSAGHIGYQLAGRVPVRAQGDGSAPAPGWSGSHEWTGWVAFNDLPHALDPGEGWVATANSRPEVPSAAFLTRDWTDDHRQRRVVELLRSRPNHTPHDFEAMQGDVVSPAAQAMVRRLVMEGFAEALACLQGWDGQLDARSSAACVYQVFRLELLRSTYRNLPATARELVCGRGLLELLTFGSVFHQQSSSLLLRLLEDLLRQGDQGRSVIADALYRTTEWLTARLGPDPAAWQWGRLHRVAFGHVLGLASPGLDRLLRLNRGPFPIGGDLDTIAQSGVDPWHPYEAATFTVSYRQVIDVGNWDDMRFILPTGQSGHPGSKHYDDMVDDWLHGRYRTLPFTRAAINKDTVQTAQLNPAT